MRTTILEQPLIPPVTWETVQHHLRLEELGVMEQAEEDYIMGVLVASAARTATKELRLALTDTRYEVACVPGELRYACGYAVLRLPFTNLLSVESVRYGDALLVEGTDYRVAMTSDGAAYLNPGELLFNAGLFGSCCGCWCACGCEADVADSDQTLLRVEYRAGYGTATADVPGDVQSWVLLRVGALYENREAVTDSTVNSMPFLDGLLSDREFEFS